MTNEEILPLVLINEDGAVIAAYRPGIAGSFGQACSNIRIAYKTGIIGNYEDRNMMLKTLRDRKEEFERDDEDFGWSRAA